MVKGLPGSDFAGVTTRWCEAIFADIKASDIKAWGGSGAVWRRGLLCVLCVVVLFLALLFVTYLCVLKMCCGDIVGIFLANSTEKCDLTRGVVLFSDHMWCNCVPVHVICGF